uniref:Glycoprotein n=1 Tax=Grapevine-associated bunya-like virus 1 TaxID=2814405 RepID=A0A8F5RBY5_9VIRU|nr:MAG: hypothetical protein [Grapevine-associated bunya-like virus 1]
MDGVLKTGSECEYYLDGKIISKSVSFPKGVSGLIKYNCDGMQGSVFAKHECKECGLYCSDNDKHDSCYHVVFPAVIGGIIGFLLGIVLLTVIQKHFQLVYAKIKTTWNNYQEERELKKEIDRHAVAEARKRRQQQAVALMLTTMALNPVVDACDFFIYSHGTSKVCSQDNCVPKDFIKFEMTAGSTICYEDKDGTMTKITLEYLKNTEYGQLLYQTPRYSLEYEDASNCYSAGYCRALTCQIGVKHPDFKNRSTLEGFDCFMSGTFCPQDWFKCAYEISCTWTHWWLVQQGQLLPLYIKSHYYKTIMLGVTIGNVTQMIEINTMNPYVEVTTGYSKIGIMEDVMQGVEVEKNRGIMVHEGKCYDVEMAQLNMPVKGMLGEVQVDVKTKKWTGQHDLVKCFGVQCKGKCIFDTPALAKFLESKPVPYTECKQLDNNKKIVTHENTHGTIQLIISDVSIDHEIRKQAKCNFEIVGEVSCKQCKYLPKATIQSYNIEEPGLMRFVSNCTFTQKFLQCSHEMYNLEQETTARFCRIRVPVMNVTKIIEFKFGYTGEIHTEQEIEGEYSGALREVSGLASNSYFLNTLVSVVGIVSGGSLLLKILELCMPFLCLCKKS